MFLDQSLINKTKAALSTSERIKLLRGMMLTRACDNALKNLFLKSAGKGFRSLGQEAIYGAGFLLNRGSNFYRNNNYQGDIVGPMIRDLGLYLCFSNDDILSSLNAQAAKKGAPSDGRDLHLGALELGILMPAAPLAISVCTLIGMALAFKIRQEPRVVLSFIGEGATSLGEWHEAINFAAVNSLPMIFCVQNNKISLSTPIKQQSKALNFADKALGYGINAHILDGNDIEEITAVFKIAGDYVRKTQEPLLLELETMRMCGHAHHDDALYLGYDPKPSRYVPEAQALGYVNLELYNKFRLRDPIKLYEEKLVSEKILSCEKILSLWEDVELSVEKSLKEIKARSWPKINNTDEELVYKKPFIFIRNAQRNLEYDQKGLSYLQALAQASADAFDLYPECVVLGEDVAAPYGNAFMLYKPLLEKYASRFINAPIGENAIIGACVGLALSGMRPIGEMQFNDFVACGMNQLVNNAAKLFYRTALKVPMVLRMPYGGLRRAGPFHSQDTSAWFYRVSGLKIMVPSTPIDAYFMLLQAIDDPDPVLFYEHIALYRDPSIKQKILMQACELNSAKIIKNGNMLTLISYGAYVHKAYRIAKALEDNNLSLEVIDLRYLKPLDLATCYESISKTNRVLLVGEDSAEGSVLQSLAAHIADDLFASLDAPVRVLGSRHTPTPYAPSLEDDYLLGEERIREEILKLLAY